MKLPRYLCCLLMLCFLLPQSLSASHEFGFGVDSTVYANRKLMANPPLPMSKLSKGTYKLSLQPAHISGEMDGESDSSTGGSNSENTDGDFSGYGGAIGFSYALSDKWALFSIAAGSQAEGNFKYQGCSNTGGGCSETKMNDSKVSSFTLAAGFLYKFNKWETSIFAGPYLNKTSFSQTVVQTSTSNVVNADYDMSGEKIGAGMLIGFQGEYKPFENFKFNPFLLVGVRLSDDCGDYEVTQVRKSDTTGSFLEFQSSPDCGGSGGISTTRQDRQFSYNYAFESVGVNVVYIPWDLSINLTAPLFDLLKSDEDPKVTLLTFSMSFGDYVR